jgi:hypothetical protein
MKSLSTLILIGTVTALIIGGIFAVTPVFAEAQSKVQLQELNNSTAAVVAPVTGNPVESDPIVAASSPETTLEDPGTVLESTFSIAVTKDWAAQEALQANEAEQELALSDTIQVQEPQAAISLDSFISSVSNGKASQVTGLYAEDILAYSVRRQPDGNMGYVSEAADEVTQFGLAAQYGTTAFLAHNYLAGASFSELTVGQYITLVYGDGSTATFRIDAIRRYQALSPDSTQSRFVDLKSGEELSASALFHAVYNGDSAVVLQTCIANEGISTWGRLFVQASPVTDTTANVTAP